MKEVAENKAALLLQLEQLVSDMSSIYSKAKICDYRNPNKCDLSLEPGTMRHQHWTLSRFSNKYKNIAAQGLNFTLRSKV
jgi:hypothetical protein